MGFGRYRFRRSFGQVKAQFRGARPKFYPLFTGLLDTYAGAAAAYSLRRLSKIASSVVRVRRASDNAEKDFTADNITDGAMVNWVNGQIVPPLDIRELDANGERTGDLVEAAAAYSLRNLSNSYAGDVVEVRRNTDGSTQDFNATEVSDNTLTDWVNTSFADDLPLDTSSGAAAAYSLRNLSESYTGSVVEVRRSSDGEEDSFTASDVADGALVAWVGAGNDGFVSKWYDQSGNANHATQGTDASQPKIVDGGSLVTGGLDFDGTDDQLDFTALNASDLAIFSVVKFDTTARQVRIIGEDSSNSEGFGISSGGSGDATAGFFRANGGSSNSPELNASISTSAEVIFSANRASNTLGLFTNGVASATATNSDAFKANSIGSATNPVDGSIQEIIIYDSDQSDKRRAIEENIGDHYGITLASFSNDGFVKTWYDQSGNTKHATQAVDASQPKIVDGGSLVSGGLSFDGVDDVLSAGAGFASSSKTVFCVNNPSSLSANGLFAFGSSQTDRFFAQYNLNSIRTEINGAQASVSATTQKNLTTNLHTTDLSVGINGGSFATTSASFSGVSASAELKIGQRFGTAFVDNFDGQLSEIIIYNSDQSDNRTAIEANIGEVYSIDLPSGVDTGYDQVDGFVETWYDQSGNGNDAVQQVSGSQPKIVDAGALVTGGIDFDGSGDNLSASYSATTSSVFSVSTPHVVGSKGLIGLGTSANKVAIFYRALNQFTQFAGETLTSSVGYSVDEQYLRFDLLAGASSEIAVNGSSVAQGSSGSNAHAGILIGDTFYNASFDGSIAEVIIYSSDQSTNREAIEANINNQYDIY